MLDEQEMPESCVDERGDSTGIIKPGVEQSFWIYRRAVDENVILNFNYRVDLTKWIGTRGR